MLTMWTSCIVTLMAALSLPGDRVVVDAFSTGLNIESVCPGMEPSHGATAQIVPSPYSISFSASSYTPNNPVTVTIKTCTELPFKGFMVQARRATVSSDQTQMIGSFTAVGGTRTSCSGSGLVHNSPVDKTEVVFDWTSPTADGHVQFWATFVRSANTYWVAVKSEVLMDASLGAPSDPATLTPATVLASACDTTLTTSAGDITTQAPVSTDSTSASLTVPSGCGTTLGCVSQCSGSRCETVITWQESEDNVVYTISSVAASPTAYVSIGFSTDSKMGGDSVTGCASASDGTIIVFNAENTGREAPVPFNDPEVTLSSSSFENSLLSCTFRRPRAGSVDGKRYDVSQKWVIMFAKGSASVSGSTANIGYHAEDKFVTSSKYSSSDTPNVGAEVPEYALVKAHGSLMVYAWIFFASIGIVVARYYKPVWTDTWLSQKVWFQIHRASMVLVLVVTLIGFLLIFLEVEGWSKLIEKKEQLEYHPHLGVVVTILTVANPVMALFRPGAGTKTRPIFNWAHWIVGNASHILAVITIFFGIELQKSQTPDYLVYVLAAYVAWQLLVQLILEIIHHRLWQKACRSSQVSDDSQAKPAEKQESVILIAKKAILILHVLVLLVFSSMTAALIAIGEDD